MDIKKSIHQPLSAYKYITTLYVYKNKKSFYAIFFSAGTSEPITDDIVNFLGMKLSVSDAETGLNATFALLIVAMFAVICSVGICMTRKKPKDKFNLEAIMLEKKM